jgi:predicted transcriptional regulator
MSQTLLEMAKDLVMAQIAAHRLSPEEMHQALQQTYASLKALQSQEDANGSVAVVTPEIPPEPVNWKKSITKHTVTCLECGQSLKQLSVRHLKDHGLDGRSYRAKYGIPRKQAFSKWGTRVGRCGQDGTACGAIVSRPKLHKRVVEAITGLSYW